MEEVDLIDLTDSICFCYYFLNLSLFYNIACLRQVFELILRCLRACSSSFVFSSTRVLTSPSITWHSGGISVLGRFLIPSSVDRRLCKRVCPRRLLLDNSDTFTSWPGVSLTLARYRVKWWFILSIKCAFSLCRLVELNLWLMWCY